VRFGTRLTCVTRGDDPPFTPSIPGLVRQLADTIGLTDYGQPILSVPILVEDRTSAEDLVNLLTDKRRTRPVFAISRTEIGTIINANYLAGQCCGAGHVVAISSEASFALTDLLGREYSVYRGAVSPIGLVLSQKKINHPIILFVAPKLFEIGPTGVPFLSLAYLLPKPFGQRLLAPTWSATCRAFRPCGKFGSSPNSERRIVKVMPRLANSRSPIRELTNSKPNWKDKNRRTTAC
jgi:hypothetical protein